jgi:hypothetical protein
MNISEVIPRENHVLYVKTDAGNAGLFDITPFLESEAFAPLKDRKAFERIRNGGYFIEWECGADISADTIQARWTPLANNGAQQGVPAGVQ